MKDGKCHPASVSIVGWLASPVAMALNTIVAKIITKKLFTKKMFWSNSFCKNYKRVTLQSKVLGLFSCKKGHASGSNITKKIFWWN